ncbi:MAG: hypothetical protein KIT20_05045 [Alphaproteobacteria bacterium]|nr:hypothetical protein [Alphaproteobacteria bacterium]
MKAGLAGIGIAFATITLLSGCAGDGIGAFAPGADPRAALPEPEISPALQAPPKPLRKPRRTEIAARPPADSDAQQSPVEEQPADGAPAPRLVGLSESEALGLLGEPEARQDARPAKLWVYKGHDCELELSFFFDVSRNAFFILDYAARDARGEGDSRERCLRSLDSVRAAP